MLDPDADGERLRFEREARTRREDVDVASTMAGRENDRVCSEGVVQTCIGATQTEAPRAAPAVATSPGSGTTAVPTRPC